MSGMLKRNQYQVTPYDTFKSWSDEPNANSQFRLFHDKSRVRDQFVANESPMPHGPEVSLLHKMFASLNSPDVTIREHTLRETVVRVVTEQETSITIPLHQLERHPFDWDPSGVLLPRQLFYVCLEFSPDLSALLKDIKNQDGPGSGCDWVSACITLDVLKRTDAP